MQGELHIDNYICICSYQEFKTCFWIFRCAAGDRADTATGRPYPVHTVAVERAVNVVTEAATAVVGEEQRHGAAPAVFISASSCPPSTVNDRGH